MQRTRYLGTIRGKMSAANGTLVSIMVAISVMATVQFTEVARLVSVVSDGSEVLMHLSHVLDQREPMILAFRKGYCEGEDVGARARFSALSSDLSKHLTRAQALASGDAEQKPLAEAKQALASANQRVAGFDAMSADDREVAAIELEEALSDLMGSFDVAKLAASKDMERRLATVKTEINQPIRMFWGAAALGGLVALLVSEFMRRRVSVPIAELSEAVSDLARGNVHTIAFTGADDIGQLGHGFNQMSSTIVERTKSLKLVLDNVGDGLITADLSGVVVGEPSQRAVEWFGAAASGIRIWDYFGIDDPKLSGQFALSYGQLVEDVLPFELCAYQMPNEFQRGDRMYALSYRQVLDADKLARVLLVASDVTEQRKTARQEREQRDVYSLASVSLADPDAFSEFCEDVDKRLARALTGEHVMFELHTVKGNSGMMGCEHFAHRVHELETRVSEEGFSVELIAPVQAHWEQLCETVERAVGRSAKEVVVIPRKEYDRLIRLMQTPERSGDAFVLAQSWSMHRVGNSLARLAKTAEHYAQRQGKHVAVAIEGGDLSVHKGALDEFWGCLVHLVKNAIAHGIETSDRRMEAGKGSAGQIALAAHVAAGELTVTVGDDGGGIDWSALQAKTASTATGIELLTRGEGVSTASETTDLAGRGVGVGAVAKVVNELGGKLEIESQLGQGTKFTVRLPVSKDAYVPGGSLAPMPAGAPANDAKPDPRRKTGAGT